MPIACALWWPWAKPTSAEPGSRTMTAAGPAQCTVPGSTVPYGQAKRPENRRGAGHAGGYGVPGASGGVWARGWAPRMRSGEGAGIPEP